MEYDVFISYSSTDMDVAQKVYAYLQQKGLKPWMAPQCILAGEPYARAITNGISKCRLMVVILSKTSNSSEDVLNEVDQAHREKKVLLPFIIDETEMSGEMRYYLSRKQWIHAYPEVTTAQYEQLFRAIRAYLPIREEAQQEMEESQEKQQKIKSDETLSGRYTVIAETPQTKPQELKPTAERRKSGVAVSSSRPASASPPNKQAKNDSSASRSKPSSTPTPPKIPIRSATTQVGKQAGKPKTTKRHQDWGSLGDIMFDVKLWLKYDFWFNIKLWFEYDFEDWITSTGLKYILIAIGLLMVGGFQLAWCKPFMDNAYFGIVPIVFALCTLCIVIWGFIKEESGWNQLLGIVSTTIFGFISVTYINVYWFGREGWGGLWQGSMATGFVEDEEVAGEIPIIGSFTVCESVSPHKWIIADMDVTGEKYGHDYVDLGLSVKWATMNIGASSPGQCGDYFAWGEISSKDTYTKENSKSHGNSKLNDIAGISSCDAARANWGMIWRLPTRDEMEELASRCTWTWGEVGNLPGYKVTGSNGKSMFLPAAGYREQNVLNCNFGTAGYYWTSTAYTTDETSIDATTYACSIGFSRNSLDSEGNYRYCGLTIRPVCE